jgi:hypothetical protein
MGSVMHALQVVLVLALLGQNSSYTPSRIRLSSSVTSSKRSSSYSAVQNDVVNEVSKEDKVNVEYKAANYDKITQESLLLSKEKKSVNFDDDSVDCLSEGGKWKMDNTVLADITKDYKSVQIKVKKTISEEVSLIMSCMSKAASPIEIVEICDIIDQVSIQTYENPSLTRSILQSVRYSKLAGLLKEDREAYIETASFLSNRIGRAALPNLEGVSSSPSADIKSDFADELVPDCELPNTVYYESPLDVLLLKIFRWLVQKEINWSSDKVRTYES